MLQPPGSNPGGWFRADSLRISLSIFNTRSDVDFLIQSLKSLKA